MARQLGEKFSLKWNLEKMKLMHDKYSKAMTEMKYSKDKFSKYEGMGLESEVTLEHHKFKATLLDSPYAVASESRDMNHCVASYASYCEMGEYAVYSIEEDRGNGEIKRSTLGLTILKSDVAPMYKLITNQHYYSHNRSIDDITLSVGERVKQYLNNKVVK